MCSLAPCTTFGYLIGMMPTYRTTVTEQTARTVNPKLSYTYKQYCLVYCFLETRTFVRIAISVCFTHSIQPFKHQQEFPESKTIASKLLDILNPLLHLLSVHFSANSGDILLKGIIKKKQALLLSFILKACTNYKVHTRTLLS